MFSQSLLAALVVAFAIQCTSGFRTAMPHCVTHAVRLSKSTPVANRLHKAVDAGRSGALFSSNEEVELPSPPPPPSEGFDISPWLSLNTRGGVLVWTTALTLVPVGFYQYFVAQGIEETRVGSYVGAIFVLLSNVLWASTYIFRVANKDMTYATQLRDYENAVLQKRLEELADDEINALMAEIDEEDGTEEAQGGQLQWADKE
jgi:hypothetical protein